MNPEFARVGRNDLERLNELVNREEVCRYLDLIPPVSIQNTIVFYEFMKLRNGIWWSIRMDGETIGSVGIIPGASGTKMAHAGDMFIYVAGDFWGRQIGTIAVSHAISEAKNAGLERIEVLVAEDNKRAVRLYEKMGFVPEGRKKNAFRIGGACQDLLVFGLLI